MADSVAEQKARRVKSIDEILSDAKTNFGELRVAETTPIIELKSSYGISKLRDVTVGTVTHTGAEYTVTADASNLTSRLESAEVGRYQPGSLAIPSLAVRRPKKPKGGQVFKAGYFDATDGFGVGEDVNGPFTFVRRNSSDTLVRKADWLRSVDIDFAFYQILRLPFLWYGAGPLDFAPLIADGESSNKKVIDRFYANKDQLVIDNPNLPISLEVSKESGDEDFDAYLAGRQFAIYGRYMPNRRINGELRENVTVGDTVIPLVTLKKKSDFKNVSVKVEGLSIINDNNILVEIRTNTSGLTSSSFGSLSNTSDGETALEADTSATAVTGGEIIWRGIFSGGTGNKLDLQTVNAPDFDFIGTENVSIVARKLAGENDASVTCLFRVREEW